MIEKLASMLLPVFWGGGGFFPPPKTDIANYGVFCIKNIHLTFHIQGYLIFDEKRISNFLGEPTLRAP